MKDLQTETLEFADAKKRKAELVLQSEKQPRLLQAEQPKAIECCCLTDLVPFESLAEVRLEGT